MAKSTGLGDNLYIDGIDLSGDVGSLSEIAGGNSPLTVTGINKSAPERLGGQRDGRINFNAWFNDAAGAAHPTLKTLPTTDRIVTYFRGTVLGNEAASMTAKQIGYDGTRGDDGSLEFTVEAQANGFGLEWGRNLGFALQGSAGAGTGVDHGASTAFGLQAYLHLFAFTGTSITVTIQESSDNAVGDPYANVTGGAFAADRARTTLQSERMEVLRPGLTEEIEAIDGNVELVAAGVLESDELGTFASISAVGPRAFALASATLAEVPSGRRRHPHGSRFATRLRLALRSG